MSPWVRILAGAFRPILALDHMVVRVQGPPESDLRVNRSSAARV